MQISRLFNIVYILLNRRHVTARELAERFEVSVRTIYRDIDALSQAGVPVYATQGAGGGIHISDAFVLNKSALTEAEQGEILLALQSISAIGHDESTQLLSRLGNLFNRESADWIEVDFSRWGDDGRDRKNLATIKEGILQRRVLSFTYHGTDGMRTERMVSPIKLIYKSRAWYLQAFCHERQAFRTFKLVRMGDVSLLDDRFDRQTLPDPPLLETGEASSVPVIAVVLRFEQHSIWRALDEYDPKHIQWEEDGRLRVEAYFQDEGWLYSYILSFGNNVEVLSPASVRENLAALLQGMLGRYRT